MPPLPTIDDLEVLSGKLPEPSSLPLENLLLALAIALPRPSMAPAEGADTWWNCVESRGESTLASSRVRLCSASFSNADHCCRAKINRALQTKTEHGRANIVRFLSRSGTRHPQAHPHVTFIQPEQNPPPGPYPPPSLTSLPHQNSRQTRRQTSQPSRSPRLLQYPATCTGSWTSAVTPTCALR